MSATFSTDTKTTAQQPLYQMLRQLALKNVLYHYNNQAAHFHYGPHHPMKPFRLMLTDHLVLLYKLHEKMDLYEPRAATKDELMAFHSEDYVEFLQRITPELAAKMDTDKLAQFNIGDDCPIFDGMYAYSLVYSGATLDASRKLISGMSDIAINWSGGLHHAKKAEPSGFCYANDIVLAILNLLRVHARVMYIDIDLHHGDGVQEAFNLTDRVMTVSFHKFNGEFFPGTGAIDEVGIDKGLGYSVNVPLKDGIDDDSYLALYKLIVEPLITKFRPTCIVQQCGADSLGYDRLGCFNLNIRAHGECVKFTKSFGIPMLVLGGGGYTPRNVSRLWCYETSVLNDVTLEPKIPSSIPTYEWFGPDYSLHPPLDGRLDNKNLKKYLDCVRQHVLEQLRTIDAAPLVRMDEIPPDLSGLTEEEEEMLKELNEDTAQGRESVRAKEEARTGEVHV
ncbi:hypothetical protein METBIDRAFT_36343 [Metschnikowia bicuspidata var. bicuspidata NRRL YB-4993]|uniref:Histone deacetylase n=1 Tax=Metschnikowia bicuspidata var. bicuspidata NRRL YB-4993 TaxID=869754 RepID=A0A1A0HFF3_9ASCO|nr:hypothetical protein METBIDRAFT_36343 [Metschnikowia bicuspidata var. bicuspidata NRRL YB-4993]OBA22715.1 hypothetical protein METBIDRAFT_36343 [Metschnikowia bicuspidata var. bicuspidata NRRL YB-4993]